MRRRVWSVLFCLTLALGLLSVPAGAVAGPTDAFYVADYAGVLSSETEQYIVEKNQTLFDSTGGQIVVVAVDFMDGMDAADYTMQVVENWGGIGDAEKNNGFVLVYAVGENKVWAMTGSGIEDELPASRVEQYLEDYFYDGYDAGEYDQATRDFFDAIYGWYESYYAGSTGGETDFHYYPEAENDYIYSYVGPFFDFSSLIVLLVVLVFLGDGWRYRRYRRRYLMPGMPPPPYIYRPFIFGRPHHHRPPRGPRPPMGGGFHGGGSFRSGGAGRGGFGGGSFRGGGGSFRGGGAGRR